MKFILSPSKTIKIEKGEWKLHTKPYFIKDSLLLNQYLKIKSPKELQNILNISPVLAQENWERNQKWTSTPKKNESTQSIFAFDGEVYRGLKAENLSEKELGYLEENLYIISGLYGLLNPSNDIMPYRLEMGNKIQIGKSKNLYFFWRDKINKRMKNCIKIEEPLINLASKEYSKVIDLKLFNTIEIDFKEYKNNKVKSIMVYLKHARGNILNWCARNNIRKAEDLKLYNENRYNFSPDLSEEKKWVFVR